jgi:hypothetical protein
MHAAEQKRVEYQLSGDLAREKLQQEFDCFSREVQLVMAEKEAKLHAFAAQSNQAHADKDVQINQLLQQISELQAWPHKVLRWFSAFLHPKKFKV